MNTKNKTIISSLLILAFLVITFLVINKNPLIENFDNTINTFLNAHQSPIVSSLALSITQLGDVYEAFIIFAIFGLFIYLKNRKNFFKFGLATFLGIIFFWIIKLLVLRVRPDSPYLLETDTSFPSGHATIATIFLLSSIFLIIPMLKNNFSKITFTIVTLIIFPLVALSRIYLSVHWTTDVIAGIILGGICFMFAEIICCQKKENVL
jgi:undecaprenyl-diphosphatase